MPKKQKESEPDYHCPVCGSTNLLVYEKTAWVLNTGEFYCHSVKSYDSDAEVRCQDNSCNWVGELKDVKKVKT